MLTEESVRSAQVDALARYFVAAGRVVPGLTIEADGRARSWWWPLPSADDRELLTPVLAEDSDARGEAHRRLATELGEAVDTLVRHRLAGKPALRLRRRARPNAIDEWIASLTTVDPWLTPDAPGVSDATLVPLAASIDAWIRSGAVSSGRARLGIRIGEPTEPNSIAPEPDGADSASLETVEQSWPVELIVQDADEPSVVVPLAEVWAGASPFATGPRADLEQARTIEQILLGLGRLARLAPELAGILDEERPGGVTLSPADLLRFAHLRLGTLDEAGIAVLLPGWWTRRGRVALRAKAATRKQGPSGTVVTTGLGLDQLVDFTWEAALGGHTLTAEELAILQRSAAAKQSLVRLRGEWIEIDPSELDAIVRHVGTGGRARAADLVRTGLGMPGLDVPEDLPVDGVRATGWLGDLLDGASESSVQPVVHPVGFVGELRPYQQRGVGWLRMLGELGLGACLADDMGLGKTAQLIASILAGTSDGPTLVVCPVSVLGNWQRELDRFAPQLRVMTHHGSNRHAGDTPFATRAIEHDVVLTTYSIVTRDISALVQVEWSRLVLDEAQQVKNPGTAQTKAVAALPATRRVALTGTPVENRLTDLWSLMQILNPGLLGTFAAFKQQFSIPIEREHDEIATELLRRVTGPFVLRRLKSDRSIIDDLPDKIEQTEHCPLTREQATLYQAVVDELIDKTANTEGIERRGLVLAGISKLKQVCNHPAHFLRDGSPLANRSGKLTRVEELLDEILDAGDKVLCFTQYAEWGELLSGHLARRYGRAPLWLHGGVRRSARDTMVSAFGEPEGPPIFLLSLKAGGTGLNLTAASHVIHLDRWWNPAVEDQATDRAYRIGQRQAVLVHKLVSSGTIEERIDETIMSKRALARRVVGTGEQWITGLSTNDLREVLSLRPTVLAGEAVR
jgi:hypothetical protein